jgi:hypothetical protein
MTSSRRAPHDEGAWVREAALAHAAKTGPFAGRADDITVDYDS